MRLNRNFLTDALRIGAMAIAISGAASNAWANLYDLTTTGSTGNITTAAIGSALVQQTGPQSTGTGVIDPFLSIQANVGESGYNTDNGLPYDTKRPQFTDPLGIAEVPLFLVNGTVYRQFLLDINQDNGQPGDNLLSLNQIQIFLTNGDPTGASPTTLTTTGTPTLTGLSGVSSTEIFRLSNESTAPSNEVRLNFNLNPGSGGGDMYLYIPNSLFTQAIAAAALNAINLTNVVLFSSFGQPPTSGLGSNDGLEEWAVNSGGTPGPDAQQIVPEPASILLLGTGLGLVARRVRRKRVA